MLQPTAEWDLHAVAQSAWVRVLRGDEVADEEVDRALVAARRTGFHRPLLSTLAHTALCRALQGRAEEAIALLDELAADWQTTSMLACGDWVVAAANAGVLLGTPTAAVVRAMLKHSPRRTPWVEAAMASLEGTLTGDPTAHLEAAEIYGRIGDATDRVLALAAAGRGLTAAGELDRVAPIAAEVADFAARNQAPRLLYGLPDAVRPDPG
jgi:hypothetical protein